MNATRQVLLLSRRSFDRRMYHGFFYELEDVLAEIESAHIAMPIEGPLGTWPRLRAAAQNKFVQLSGGLRDTEPTVMPEALGRDFDLFFFLCQRPHQLSFLRKLPEWKKRSRLRVCYLTEIFANEFHTFRTELEEIRQFDHIFLTDPKLVSRMQSVTGRPCHYLPVAVDTLRFSLGQGEVSRRIDCHSMGRRNERIHKALLEHAQTNDFFYVHDTARFFDFTSHTEHRRMLAAMLRRSRYSLCQRRDDNDNVLLRMYEASAAGAVMLGDPPDTDDFRAQFDWPDAMIPVPDPDRVADQIRDLDRQPQRLAALRKTGAVQALQRHDWVHRWKSVLQVLGLEEGPGVRHREDKLLSMAARIAGGTRAASGDYEGICVPNLEIGKDQR